MTRLGPKALKIRRFLVFPPDSHFSLRHFLANDGHPTAGERDLELAQFQVPLLDIAESLGTNGAPEGVLLLTTFCDADLVTRRCQLSRCHLRPRGRALLRTLHYPSFDSCTQCGRDIQVVGGPVVEPTVRVCYPGTLLLLEVIAIRWWADTGNRVEDR